MGVHVRPHPGVWLWLGVALGLSGGQGKDARWGLAGDGALACPDPHCRCPQSVRWAGP